MISSLVLAVLGVAGPAQARDGVLDHLAAIDVDSQSVAARVERLEEQVAPGRGFISEQQAVERYQDYVYLHMIGEDALAAEGFFTLVTTAALGDAGLHRDAEWYLAESLYKMGNVATAEARYMVIAQDDDHPFREDAVRRLLELYAETEQQDAFDRMYREEILNGRVRPSDLITYSLAKSFFRQENYAEARARFDGLGPDSPYWGRAQYYLGALDVLSGDLDAAVTHFLPVTELSVQTHQERQLLDLSLLALGRIAYERGQFAEASEWYSSISGDSEYLADKLYELVWTFIKQEEYQAALDGVDIFLIRYPEHEYTAKMQLLQGHLRMEEQEYDAALIAYEGVAQAYAPVRDQFGALSQAGAEARPYFEQMLAAEDTGFYETGDLPGYAVAMMLSDEGLSRALTVYRDLGRQQARVAESEALIAELEVVLASDVGLGGFEHLRYSISLNQEKAIDATLALLAEEEDWLEREGGPDAPRLLAPLRQRREVLADRMDGFSNDMGVEERRRSRQRYFEELALLDGQVVDLRAELSDLSDALAAQPEGPESGRQQADQARIRQDIDDIMTSSEALRTRGPRSDWEAQRIEQEDAFTAEVGALRREYRDLRRAVTGGDKAIIVARMDGIYGTLEHSTGRLSALRSRLGSMESSELARIRTRFGHEVSEVMAQKVELSLTSEEADLVSADLTRAGFGRLEDFFSSSILHADMGVVDVYWSRTLDIVDQRTRVAEEKSRLLQDLEMRFDVIRQKMGRP